MTAVKKNLNKLLILSVLLIPILLVTGPFLPDLLLSISVLIFLFLIIDEKELNIFKNYFFYFSFFFLLVIILNSIYSENLKSIISSIGFFRFLIFNLMIVFVLNYLNIDFRFKLFQILIVTYCYLFLEFFSQVFFGKTLIQDVVHNSTRLVLSSFHYEEVFSSYIVRIYPLFVGLYYIFKEKISKLKILFYLLNIFVFFSVIFNGERTAIGLLIILTILMLIFLKQKLVFKLSSVLFSVIFFVIVSLNLPGGNLERKIEGLNKVKDTYLNLNNEKKNSEIIFFSEKYNSLYRTSYNIFKQNIIFGVGIKNFRVECSKEIYAHNKRSCSTHPHNVLFQIMAETGMVGILYYLLIISLVVYYFFKNFFNKKISNDKKNYITCLFLSIILTIIPFFPSGNLFNNWMLIITFFPVGFLLSEFIKKPKNK